MEVIFLVGGSCSLGARGPDPRASARVRGLPGAAYRSGAGSRVPVRGREPRTGPGAANRPASPAGYAATEARAPIVGLWRRASRAGTKISAVATQAISPISEARPKPRIAMFSLISSEP